MPEQLEALSGARKNIAPQAAKEGTPVNVKQANCMGMQNPRDALAGRC